MVVASQVGGDDEAWNSCTSRCSYRQSPSRCPLPLPRRLRRLRRPKRLRGSAVQEFEGPAQGHQPGRLIANMKFFSQSLGVRCTYCHVGTDGQPLSTFDFASDAKEHKSTARAMLAMVATLNLKTLPAATGLPDAKVTCFTCHRGSTKPATEVPAGVVRCRPLRGPLRRSLSGAFQPLIRSASAVLREDWR